MPAVSCSGSAEQRKSSISSASSLGVQWHLHRFTIRRKIACHQKYQARSLDLAPFPFLLDPRSFPCRLDARCLRLRPDKSVVQDHRLRHDAVQRDADCLDCAAPAAPARQRPALGVPTFGLALLGSGYPAPGAVTLAVAIVGFTNGAELDVAAHLLMRRFPISLFSTAFRLLSATMAIAAIRYCSASR